MSNNPKARINGEGTVPPYLALPNFDGNSITISTSGNIVTGAGTNLDFTEMERKGLLKVGDWIYVASKNILAGGTFALRKITAILDATHLKIESQFSTIATPSVDTPIPALTPLTIVRASRATEISASFIEAGALNGIPVPLGFATDDSRSSKTQRGQQDFPDPITVFGGANVAAGVV